MVFDLNFQPYIFILLAVAVASSCAVLFLRFFPMRKISTLSEEQTGHEEGEITETAHSRLPKISVVVHTFSDEEDIVRYLEMLMAQEYPDYEVILVNEGNNEVTHNLTERLTALYPERLYITFIPPGSHNLSRRKLALTLGIKAAKGDIILTTASNCRIPSVRWLSLMASPFISNSTTAVVLGYSHIFSDSLKGAGKWYRCFDNVLTSCQWISAALNDNPYRGDGNNLAFRKQLFFENKGYSSSLNLVNGDDDIFVNEITDSMNTEVMLAEDSILSVDWGESANRISADLKARYSFTSAYLPAAPFLREGYASLFQWVALLAFISTAIPALPNLLPAAVAAVLFVIFVVVEMILYNKAAKSLRAPAAWMSLPFFLLWRPFGNAFFRMRHRRHRIKNFTFS